MCTQNTLLRGFWSISSTDCSQLYWVKCGKFLQDFWDDSEYFVINFDMCRYKTLSRANGPFFFLYLKWQWYYTLDPSTKIYERFSRQVGSVCCLLKSFITLKGRQTLQIFDQHARKGLLKVTASCHETVGELLKTSLSFSLSLIRQFFNFSPLLSFCSYKFLLQLS